MSENTESKISEYQSRTKKRVYLEENVFEKALDRIRHLYDLYEDVMVSFSGGKDSTVILNLAIIVATERNRLPVKTFFWDEEAVAPPTIEYVERIRNDPRVSLRWLCLPVLHRNGCSRHEPIWRPFDPEKRELWVREPPPYAETELAGFTGDTIPKSTHLLNSNREGTPCHLVGVRGDESLRRYWINMLKVADNYVVIMPGGWAYAKPIYDWGTEDVWLAPYMFGWDYNRTYDYFDLLGIPRKLQRISAPYGEEPMQVLYMFQKCFPEMWDKMIHRVAGAATAARYATSELYAFKKCSPVMGETFQSSIELSLRRYDPETAAIIASKVRSYIELHKSKTIDPIPDDRPHAVTGVCWRRLFIVALRGDSKGRRQPTYKADKDGLDKSKAILSGGVARNISASKKQRTKLGFNITEEMALNGLSESSLLASRSNPIPIDDLLAEDDIFAGDDISE